MPSSNPPTDENGVIKIDFRHFSLKLRSLMVLAALLGVGGGGWHLVGQAQNIAFPKSEVESLKRDHALELQLIRIQTKLDTLDYRVETLSKLVAANLAATTEGDQKAIKAAIEAAEKVDTDPLSVLAP